MTATALALQPAELLPPAARDHRRAHRRAERTSGLIKVRGYRISVPCLLQNTSATGACVLLNAGTTIEDAEHLPDTVVIVFVRELVEIDAQIMWRDANRFG